MGINVKTGRRRAPAKTEKLIKVPPEVHHRIKVKAAQEGKSMGKFLDDRTKD